MISTWCVQGNILWEFHIQGAEGEDDKQVKVATVRKDICDLKENFPLHITIGPKVGPVIFFQDGIYILFWNTLAW